MRSSQQWITLRAPPVNQTAHPARRQAGFYFKIKILGRRGLFLKTDRLLRGWTIMIVKLLHNTPIRFYRLSVLSLFFQPELIFVLLQVWESPPCCFYFYGILLFNISNVFMKMLPWFVPTFAKPSKYSDLACAPYWVKQLIQAKI